MCLLSAARWGVSNLDRLSPCLLDRESDLDPDDRLLDLDRLRRRLLPDPDPRLLLDDLPTIQTTHTWIEGKIHTAHTSLYQHKIVCLKEKSTYSLTFEVNIINSIVTVCRLLQTLSVCVCVSVCLSVPLLWLISRLLWVGFWSNLVKMLELWTDWLH